ncbi:MAG TPA: metalloregulator ArsR/SmtB family transcription factor [Thermodesulfobacteriota bacterium]|nr:metalloregulator ArsR/SmtB family transcription factor [Thermodesulfobacteriota bacterium]HNU72220.1 metalloregulator ArsR/SmtB family transcription factor [Thermodesulfobacteriota bacterium]HQO77592.1 metalloregulator ArsR/SmtB family transcription factor [Thermodesulfobacteriota bacterium]
MKRAATIFQALSDHTRLRIMKLLETGELCVCELMQVLDMSQPRISRHLGILKNAGLVNDRRQGKWVFYSLRNGVENEDIQAIVSSLALIGNSNPLVLKDREALTHALRLSELDESCARCSRQSSPGLSNQNSHSRGK